MELSQGTTLKISGKVIRADPVLPNLDFLTMPSKEPQRIQHKHYKEFIKHGNLKRLMHMETTDEPGRTHRELLEDESSKEFPSNELHKAMRRSTNESNIVIKNLVLFRDLKNLKSV